MNSTVDALVHARRGYVIAPAGYGKTEVIAAAAKQDGDRRHLVLTHTHAGVDALKTRLRQHGVPTRAASVHTLAGFSLRYAASYPATSRLEVQEPTSTHQWRSVYEAANRLLRHNALTRVVRASYDTVFVDEYQDCNNHHHALVLALAELLPVRILGDPLQGVLHFVTKQGESLVDWDEHVRPTFDELPTLETPHRWRDTNPALGEWLADTRRKLIAGETLDLDGAPVDRFEAYGGAQQTACLQALRHGGTVAAITDLPNRAHEAARRLRGYTCMEPMDSDELAAAAQDLDVAAGTARAGLLLGFCTKSMTGVSTLFKAAAARYDKGELARVTPGRKYTAAIVALNTAAADTGPDSLLSALDAVAAVPDIRVYRRELVGELRRALKQQQRLRDVSLAQCAWEVRERTRHRGRRPSRLSVARPPLVKGLEFDHAVLLHASDFKDARDLYVSLTRGARLVSLVGEPRRLPPMPGMTAP